MKKHLALVLTLLVFLVPLSATASESQVSVTIPAFPITINGTAVDYRNDRYPFILYNGITYFPMTFDHCSYLGVGTAWTEQDGLYVAAVVFSSGELPDYGKGNNSAASYTAQIVSFPIHVNGKKIDNTQEAYPLLLFRDITYFPMTWRFATEEFSWETGWDNDSGLDINIVDNRRFYVVAKGNESAHLERHEAIYNDVLNQDGTVTHYYDHDRLYYARLNYADDSVTSLNSMPTPPDRDYEDAGVYLQDDSLYYDGTPIVDISDIVALDAQSEYGSGSGYPIMVYSAKTAFNEGYYISVEVYYQNYIPAPYTPHQYYHFITFNSSGIRQLDFGKGFGDGERMNGAYPVSDGIYISTVQAQRYVGSKYTLWFVPKDGEAVNVNDKFNDFDNIRILGTVGDTIYLKCLWRQASWPSTESPESVSLINDGYYSMEKDFSLVKIYPFIASTEEILTPTGTLYAIPGWRNGILNLTSGKLINLSDLPVSEVYRRE